MSEFFHMGGHGFFIWTSYAVFTVTLLWLYFSTVIKRKKFAKSLLHFFRSE